MVSKCANPGCSAPFLYLRQGKLFCIETSMTADDQGPSFGADPAVERRSRRMEFFWLCEDCTVTLTLRYTPGHGVKVHPRVQAAQAAIAAG
jgi:hypothetical protein